MLLSSDKGGSSGTGSSEDGSSESGSTNGDSALTSDISLAGGGGGGGVLASLGSGGGGVSDGCSLVGGGTVEPGSASLLPGTGGASLETGPGVRGALGCGDSLVGGGGGMLVPLESAGGGGGVSDVVDVVLLGVPEPGPGSLLPGTGLGTGASLEGPGVLGALPGEPLVGGGGPLVPLGSGGGVTDVSD
jgi:hypothetical protein